MRTSRHDTVSSLGFTIQPFKRKALSICHFIYIILEHKLLDTKIFRRKPSNSDGKGIRTACHDDASVKVSVNLPNERTISVNLNFLESLETMAHLKRTLLINET